MNRLLYATFALLLLCVITYEVQASFLYNKCGAKTGVCPAGITCTILGSACNTPDPAIPSQAASAEPMGTCNLLGIRCLSSKCQCYMPSGALMNGCKAPKGKCA